MRRVRRLEAVPAAMEVYLDAHPEEVAAPAGEAREVWDRFRDDAAYKEVLAALVQAQQGLCLYCEQRLVDGAGRLIHQDYQIEHVAPKASGDGRTLDAFNLALACGGGTYSHHKEAARRAAGRDNESCGQRKGDDELFPCCDPRFFPESLRVVMVDLQGRLSPDEEACQDAGIDAELLREAIQVRLNLNCERLRLARKKTSDHVRSWLVQLLGEIVNGSHLSDAQRQEMVSLLIAGRLQADGGGHLRAFWTTERCALAPASDAWCALSGA
jgi:uncharacterized protein (TIGR02646 family)